MPDEVEARARRGATLAILVGTALLWLPGLPRSLWLDETGTYWVASGGFQDTIDRAVRFQGQSPLYFLVAWVARRLGGGSEIVLRLPSVMFMAGAALILYRLIAALTDRTAALLGTAVFVTSWKIVMEANDARPYALGLLLVVGAMYALIRWFQTGHPRFAVAYVLCAALSLYAHYLLGPMFLVHLACAIAARRSGTRVTKVQMGLAGIAVALLLTPLIPQFLAVLAKRGAYSWTGTPGLKSLAIALIPPVTAAGILLGLGAARILVRAQLEGRPPAPWFAFAWVLVPVMSMFGISRFTSTKIFAPMYVIAAEPGFAVLAGWYLAGLRPRRAAPIVVVGLVIATLVSLQFRPFPHEDWRGAIAEINRLDGADAVGVMCSCGFVEASQIEWLRDPARVKFLNAPLAAYPPRGEVLRLPDDNPKLRAYAAESVDAFVPRHDLVVFLGRGDSAARWAPWLKPHLEHDGFQARPIGRHEGVSLLLFERAKRISP